MSVECRKFKSDVEVELIVRAQNGELEAREALHVRLSGALDKIAKNPRHVKSYVSYEEIREEADRELDVAIDSWNTEIKNPPVTWIYGQIDKKLMRYVHSRSPLHIPENYVWYIGKYRDVVNALPETLTDEEILALLVDMFPKDRLNLKSVSRIRPFCKLEVKDI